MKFLNYLIRIFFSLIALISLISLIILIANFLKKPFDLTVFMLGSFFFLDCFIISFFIALNKITITSIINREKFTRLNFFVATLLFSLIGFYLAFSKGPNSETKTFDIAVAGLVLLASLSFLLPPKEKVE